MRSFHTLDQAAPQSSVPHPRVSDDQRALMPHKHWSNPGSVILAVKLQCITRETSRVQKKRGDTFIKDIMKSRRGPWLAGLGG